MDADYSALNPAVWGVFWGFVAVVAAALGWFRKRYPDYPCDSFPLDEDDV